MVSALFVHFFTLLGHFGGGIWGGFPKGRCTILAVFIHSWKMKSSNPNSFQIVTNPPSKACLRTVVSIFHMIGDVHNAKRIELTLEVGNHVLSFDDSEMSF